MARCEVNYDHLHEFYDSRYKTDYLETCEALELMRVKDILKEVPIRVSTILDYGCGRGRWINLLLDIFPNAEITGVDISNEAIKKAKEMFPMHRFYSFNGERAPFDNDSFCLIFCYHVLEHVYDFKKTIQDLCRLVKKKGYICVILPCGNEGSFEERVVGLIRGGKEESIKGEIRFYYEDSGHIRRMKSEEVIKSFKINNVSLYKDFYGDQLWGAIYWISKTGPNFRNEMFDSSRATNNAAKMKLICLKIGMGVLSLPMRLCSVNLYDHMINSKSILKKIMFLMLMPFKIVSFPLWKIIEMLTILEWKNDKKNRNGTAQYLLLKKNNSL